MKNSYRFFQNKECEWFPCHSTQNPENFSCLMCYCPLYLHEKCGGNYTIIDGCIKDCSRCLIPHTNYDYILKKITELNNEKKRVCSRGGELA